MRRKVDTEFVILFGENLRKVRKSKKMTMEKLAEKADMEYSQISRIEKGQINTSISTVKLLADALGVDAKDLFDF
ncbi:helix-turn-helix domain-containing protein [Pseudofulvibacter geojedonensis]|uniref:Helix-turn-helix domain-containing protein n=1 Tax=Pseudofulvibacter geojedonensis TaxID=1123758 RepID=A0ABW3I0X0_9FLAO